MISDFIHYLRICYVIDSVTNRL